MIMAIKVTRTTRTTATRDYAVSDKFRRRHKINLFGTFPFTGQAKIDLSLE